LSALTTCTTLLTNAVSELTRDVAADVVRAELWRATCLHQFVRLLRSEIPVRCTPTPVQSLVARVLEAIEPERRVRGVLINRQLTLSHGRIDTDEDLLVCALSSLLVATFGLVHGRTAEVTVLGRLDPGGDFTFSVAQDSLAIPASWGARGRHEASATAEGIGAVALLATERILEHSNGRLAVGPSGRGGAVHVMIPSVP
jgi:hypothetical protein